PATNTGYGVQVAGFSLGFGDPVLPSLLAFWQTGAVLLLLIACVNVAHLILARGAERRRELALPLALGAGRPRILGPLLTEGLVPSLLAVPVAMPLVVLAMRAIRDNMPPEVARFIPGWNHLEPDLRTLVFSVALAVVATGAFSAIPALRASRPDLNDAL